MKQPTDDDQEVKIGAPSPPSTKIGNLDDRARFWLAIIFSLSYISMIAILFLYAIFNFEQEKITAIMAVCLAPLGTLVGGIVGFYFGSKADK